MQGGEATATSLVFFLVHSLSHSPLLASLVATRCHHEVPNPSLLLVVTGWLGDVLVLGECVDFTAIAIEVVVHCVVHSEHAEVIVVVEDGDCTERSCCMLE
jgi:hypothetical protein